MDFENDFDKNIRTLVEKGVCHVSPDEINVLRMNILYGTYQSHLDTFNMEPVPLLYDAKTAEIKFLPEFMTSADPDELHYWQMQFLKNYDEGKDFDDDEPDNLYPRTPILNDRTRNSDYAQHFLENMFSIPHQDNDVEIDDYGWIENRREEFYEALTFVCDRYTLPRLPVKFGVDDKPYFHAMAKEIQTISAFAAQRYIMLNELDTNAIDIYRQKRLDLNPDLSSEEAESQVRFLLEELRDMRDIILEQCKEIWAKENQQHHFPSAIELYPSELMVDFEENKDKLAPNRSENYTDLKIASAHPFVHLN